MKILALYSNKGGVGKTTAAVNLSYMAAHFGYRTLICDLDAQASATFYFRVKPKLKPKAKGLTKGGQVINKNIKGTDYNSLDLLPADFSHRSLDVVFSELKDSTRRLSRITEPLSNEYDLIIFDCPATINMLAENVFNTSDVILVPLMPTTLSVRAHKQLFTFCKKGGYDRHKIYAFLSMVDKRKKLHRELTQTLQTEFSDSLLNSIIPYASDVEKMGIERQPLNVFAPNATVSKTYHALWGEVKELLFS